MPSLLNFFNCYFNSIKVQLERLNPYLMMDGGSAFQFHKGTIRTICLIDTCSLHRYFNSIKVQLEHFAAMNDNLANTISIP